MNCAALHLFNHESELRSVEFVSAKIVHGAIDISSGFLDYLELGNLDLVRDWGWAEDYMEAFILSALSYEPRDYIVATGKSISLKCFVSNVFSELGLDWEKYVVYNEKFTRINEPNSIYVNPNLIRKELGWSTSVVGNDVPKMLVKRVLKLRKYNEL